MSKLQWGLLAGIVCVVLVAQFWHHDHTAEEHDHGADLSPAPDEIAHPNVATVTLAVSGMT